MCECCNEIGFWKECVNKSKVITCKLVIKNKDNRGTITTKAFDLNYCPMCGRKLGENK